MSRKCQKNVFWHFGLHTISWSNVTGYLLCETSSGANVMRHCNCEIAAGRNVKKKGPCLVRAVRRSQRLCLRWSFVFRERNLYDRGPPDGNRSQECPSRRGTTFFSSGDLALPCLSAALCSFLSYGLLHATAGGWPATSFCGFSHSGPSRLSPSRPPRRQSPSFSFAWSRTRCWGAVITLMTHESPNLSREAWRR